MSTPALDTLLSHAPPALQAWAAVNRPRIENAIVEQIRFELQVVEDNREARKAQARDKVIFALHSDPDLRYLGVDGIVDRMLKIQMLTPAAADWIVGEGDEHTNAPWERFLTYWMSRLKQFQNMPQDKRLSSFQSRAQSEFWMMKRGALGDTKAWEDLRKAIAEYLNLWSRDWYASKAQERQRYAVTWMPKRFLGSNLADAGLYRKSKLPPP